MVCEGRGGAVETKYMRSVTGFEIAKRFVKKLDTIEPEILKAVICALDLKKEKAWSAHKRALNSAQKKNRADIFNR